MSRPPAADTEDTDSEGYEVEYALRSLRGLWSDTKGSSYKVLVHGSGEIVEIRTTRPSGQTISTRGLVHWDAKSGWIVWGRSGARSQYWLSELSSDTLLWEREGSKAFSWSRTGGVEDFDEEEEEDEEE